ncbi:hypothetical protein GCM10010306_080420 [Streptomyces umbrinus]|nr:hypothetical protein GCM10010306_080420 [Streptomyces umbrinus]GHH61787.1 hypothetical protein GCM10018775_77020 [Streptomyces umbrinus]
MVPVAACAGDAVRRPVARERTARETTVERDLGMLAGALRGGMINRGTVHLVNAGCVTWCDAEA